MPLDWNPTRTVPKGPREGEVIEWSATGPGGWQFVIRPPFGRRTRVELVSKLGSEPDPIEIFGAVEEAMAAAELKCQPTR